MQQQGIKRFFSQPFATPGSAGGSSAALGPDAGVQAPSQQPKRSCAGHDENARNSNKRRNSQIPAQTPAALKPGSARTSFLQSAEIYSKSTKTTPPSCTLTTPGLLAGRAYSSVGQHTSALGTPDADRGVKLQRRLACEPEGDSELKKIEEKFKWLHSQNRRDGKGRTSQDPAYDGVRTIQIPEAARAKLSGSQKQYWEVKSQYLDVMLFFKVGKFYELYEEDAAIAYEVLGYKVTVSGVGRCRQAGVPESGLQTALAALVAAGYKVGVIEQIETGEEAKKRDPKAIVRRKLTSVETPATPLDPAGTDSVHLLSVVPVQATEGRTLGGVAFAVLNAAECALLVGFLREDALGSALSTLLAYTTPAEVLVPNGPSAELTARRIEAITPTAHIIKLPLDESPAPHTALKALAEGSKYGSILSGVHEHVAEGDVSAVAAAVLPLLQHLQRMCLDDKLQDAVLQVLPFGGGMQRMRLDCTALTNLEVLQGSTGMRSGSLLEVLDSCVSVSGKRLIRAWLSQPLCDVVAIIRRQHAVQDILANSTLMQVITDGLRGLPDMDRAVGRVRTALAPVNPGLPLHLQQREQQRRLTALRSALEALQQSVQLLRTVAAYVPASTEAQPDVSPLLAELCAAAPDDTHDACGLLEELPKTICAVPAASASQARKSQGRNSKKSVEQTVLRLSDGMFEELKAAEDEEARLEVEASHLTTILTALLEQSAVWQAMSVAMSSLDVLAALARFAQHEGGATCFPEFVRDSETPELDCKGLWHPALAGRTSSSPIPTDLNVGSEYGAALLLTGPNMGGKSTLLRATSTAVIFAHIGAPVPASACRLTPVDAIFTRLGASDSILQGKSTFMVESEETASILQASTPNSLVILDELGRGTSTFDGYSIAAAVFGHLVQKGCRMLFATHYHPLTDEFSHAVPGVQLGHMGAEFSAATQGHSHGRVVFKYKLQAGACPKSYGLHVAALAGIPPQICHLADQVGSALESRLSICFRNSTAKWATVDAAMAVLKEAEDDSDCDLDVALFTPQVARVLQAAKDGSLPEVQRDLRRLLPALGAL